MKYSYKEASNVKGSVHNLQLEQKNIKNDIFKTYKKSKITPKTPKSQKLKKKNYNVIKGCIEYKISKQAIVIIGKNKNGILEVSK